MTKPFLTYDLQLNKLSNEKKLIITDSERAKQILKSVGYFSLIGGYKTPFINPMTRIYQSGTAFDDIFALYQFDQSLRELVFKYLCQIEQQMRQLISYSFCKVHGEQQSAYLNPANFNNIPKNTLKYSPFFGMFALIMNDCIHFACKSTSQIRFSMQN